MGLLKMDYILGWWSGSSDKHLPSKHEALSSIPSPPPKKNSKMDYISKLVFSELHEKIKIYIHKLAQ
jgi:hypothetical protein